MSFNPNNPHRENGKENNRTSFLKAADGFSIVAAFAATIMICPYLFAATWPLVEQGMEPTMKKSLGGLLKIVFMPVSGLLVYFFLRMSLSVALSAGAIAFAARFLT